MIDDLRPSMKVFSVTSYEYASVTWLSICGGELIIFLFSKDFNVWKSLHEKRKMKMLIDIKIIAQDINPMFVGSSFDNLLKHLITMILQLKISSVNAFAISF